MSRLPRFLFPPSRCQTRDIANVPRSSSSFPEKHFIIQHRAVDSKVLVQIGCGIRHPKNTTAKIDIALRVFRMVRENRAQLFC
jgi:hypothetical protein